MRAPGRFRTPLSSTPHIGPRRWRIHTIRPRSPPCLVPRMKKAALLAPPAQSTSRKVEGRVRNHRRQSDRLQVVVIVVFFLVILIFLAAFLFGFIVQEVLVVLGFVVAKGAVRVGIVIFKR